MLSSQQELRRKIDAMEKPYDARLQAVLETIQRMLETPVRPPKSHRISRPNRPAQEAREVQ